MIALLCPGQGSQRPGSLHAAARLAHGAALLDEASELLEVDVLSEDDEPALLRTDVVQRNTFLASVASARALEDAGLRTAAVAGHSIGAFAAAVAARALEFPDALKLVDLRGRAMGAAFGSGHAMGVVSGLDERAVSAIAQQVPGVFVSAENAPDQITIAGTSAGVDRTLAAAHAQGARTARRLEVTVPSHTPLMNPVRDLLREAVRRVPFHRPIVPYAANCDGRAKFEGADVAADLAESVALPVRWFEATQMLYERGARTFVETLPGDTLATLAAATFPGAIAVSVEQSGIAGALERARVAQKDT
jgi:malonate decarboxylase epsilon subunit